MATLASDPVRDPTSIEHRERRFFMGMAIAITAWVVSAFFLYALVGISSLASPWWVHVHGVTFMGWIGLYLVQNTLVFQNRITLHRRLGYFMAGWAVWMLLVGLGVTTASVAAGRVPPIFTPPYLLALDWLNVVLFALLIGVGLALRRSTDWHRRLMLCATICVIIPASGRLLVLVGQFSLNRMLLVQLVFVAIGMGYDWRRHGRVHPAWFCGVAALAAMAILVPLLAQAPPLVAFADRIRAD